MQVKDIMTKKVVSVDPDENIMRVADIIFKNGFHGMPVIEKGKVIGIITEDDFFLKGYDDLYLPSYIQFLKSNKVVDGLPRNIKNKIEKLIEAKAKDLMTAPCITLSPTTSISRLMALIKKTKFTTWPVTDKKNNLIGIVTLVDILGAFRGGVGEMGIAYEKSAERKREVDFLARDVQTFWGKTYVFINKTHIRTWKGVFFIAFVSGAIAALIWTISIRIQTKSQAQTKSIGTEMTNQR
jgi:acetoin utilization protein AcuB